jgi:TonB family protein
MTRPPTPPPQPKRTPAPRTTASAPPSRKGPGNAPQSGGATEATPPPAVQTPEPVATATAISCAAHDIQAAVLSTPAPPEIPPETRASGTNGVAAIGVELDAGGQVTRTTVSQSTGNTSLDLVAVSMARDARYSPALHDCKPVASAYTFSVKFVAW